MFRNTVVGVVAIVVLVLGLLTYCQVVAPQQAASQKAAITQPQVKPVPAPTRVEVPTIAPTSPEQTEFVEYVVKKGDTLSEISEQHHRNWRRFTEIATDSNVKNPDLIYPGQKLLIRS